MSILIVIFLLVGQFAALIAFIVSLWRAREPDWLSWLLKVLYTAAFLLLLGVIGRWDWVSYYLIPIFVLHFAAAAVISFRRMRGRPFVANPGGTQWLSIAVAALILLFFAGIAGVGLRGYFYSGDAVRLTFPLRDGWYYVGQGGNSTLINYHNASRTQRYALDVSELNAMGARAWGIAPKALDRYAIYGATVHSPCDGTVREAVVDLPDLIPPATDRDRVAGNHVVIGCQGVTVLLTHLQNGSVVVSTGDRVTTGQPLGRVGNTGNTTEPHLHIHAVRGENSDPLDGEGVPIRFEGRFQTRNSLLRR